MAARAHICVFSDVAPKITKNAHDLHGHYLTVPGLIEFGDIGAVAALVAPHPQLVCVGANDPLDTPRGLEGWAKKGNYMRKCASGGQSLANAERGVGLSGFAGKIGDLYAPPVPP